MSRIGIGMIAQEDTSSPFGNQHTHKSISQPCQLLHPKSKCTVWDFVIIQFFIQVLIIFNQWSTPKKHTYKLWGSIPSLFSHTWPCSTDRFYFSSSCNNPQVIRQNNMWPHGHCIWVLLHGLWIQTVHVNLLLLDPTKWFLHLHRLIEWPPMSLGDVFLNWIAWMIIRSYATVKVKQSWPGNYLTKYDSPTLTAQKITRLTCLNLKKSRETSGPKANPNRCQLGLIIMLQECHLMSEIHKKTSMVSRSHGFESVRSSRDF